MVIKMECPNCGYEIETPGPIKIKKAIMTCGACPSQWDAWTENDEYVYVRYRYGYLTIDYGIHGKSILEKSVGDGMCGVMSFNELKHHTVGTVEWPEWDESEDSKLY